MPPLLFWFFAIVMLVFGCSVIAQPNPVSSALSLVVSFIALAALFVSLNAYFIGIIQVLVYAGAVMVLFLFIIMLLDLKAGSRKRAHMATIVGGILIAALFVTQLMQVLSQFPGGHREMPPLAATRGRCPQRWSRAFHQLHAAVSNRGRAGAGCDDRCRGSQ